MSGKTQSAGTEADPDLLYLEAAATAKSTRPYYRGPRRQGSVSGWGGAVASSERSLLR